MEILLFCLQKIMRKVVGWVLPKGHFTGSNNKGVPTGAGAMTLTEHSSLFRSYNVMIPCFYRNLFYAPINNCVIFKIHVVPIQNHVLCCCFEILYSNFDWNLFIEYSLFVNGNIIFEFSFWKLTDGERIEK